MGRGTLNTISEDELSQNCLEIVSKLSHGLKRVGADQPLKQLLETGGPGALVSQAFQIGIKYRFSVRLLFILTILKFPLAICPHDVYNIDMTIVNTATLKQQLSHYLGLARQGKDVLITSHKRVIAHLLAEVEGGLRLPVREPTKDASILKGIGGFGFNGDPAESIITERNAK